MHQKKKMSKENKLVPKLRFPEFENEEGWYEQPLGKICKLVRGPFGGALKKDIFVKKGHAVYEQSHAIYEDFSSFRYYINDEKFSELKRFSITSGDLIMSCSGTMGKFAKIPQNFKKGIINQALLKLSVNENKSIDFIKLSLELPINQEKLLSQSAGGAIKNVVSVDQIRELSISIPNPEEQQKIADCLSSLDDLITAENEKLAALKNHKSGLMQQLFPAEGEKVPKLRFPEFKNSGDWEFAPIGIKINLLSGYAFKSHEISDNVTGTRLVRGINVTEGRIRHSIEIDRYFLGSLEKLGKFRVQKNDLVIAMDGSKVGKNTALVTASDEGGLLVQRVARLRADSESLIKYIFHQVNSVKFHSYVDRINTSSGIPHISSEQIKSFQIHFPPLDDELQKIENFISYLNSEISEQTKKIESLKLHKQGLMQQLFPTIN
ncbi:restriction endonuclease subunit S [Pedobacter sp. BG31]|uniref:restriction endonuclease subunit S n=1 Tax=Pedobacter sp. BG31 TaxID=3349697 RepID=UPI0035F4490C